MSGNWLKKVKKKGFIAGTPKLSQSTKIYHIINEIKHDSIFYFISNSEFHYPKPNEYRG